MAGDSTVQTIKANDTLVAVQHGNRPESKHSRRRSDRFNTGEFRTLEWGCQDSDILLCPHSPLALADILSQKGGFLDLIAQDDTAEALHDDPTVALPDSILLEDEHGATDSAAAQSPEVSDRYNLLTQHSQDELLAQCKKILVENALVKNKGERQLYLAAGFISWLDTAQSHRRQRAPLLLYPALLVRVPGQSRYEIRLAGETPEFNQTLLIHVAQRFGVEVPEYDDQMTLSHFFGQVAQRVNQTSALSLDLDVALGSAALFVANNQTQAPVDLPDVPTHFDVSLAMSITGNKNLGQLNAVLQLIPDYTHINTGSEPDTTATAPDAGIAALRQYAARLAADGLDHVEFRQLASLPALMEKWAESIRSALTSDTVNRVLEFPDLSARELIRLSSIIELIDKAPASIEQVSHPDLCFANSTVLLRRAQHQAKLIEDELSALQTHFVLEKVPSKSQLLSLISELESTIEHEPDLVDADYFNARRQFMEFSTEKPANLTTEHRQLLSQLAKVLRFRELFVNNTEYRTALGPGYKGLRTDWKQLGKTCEYARELAEVLESESIAAGIMRNWLAFRSTYSAELETLQVAAEASRRLLGTLGTLWQSKTAASLVIQSQLIATRVLEWQKLYGNIDSHAEKTPAIVLSSFSGKSREDVVVESQVDETRTRINKQLLAGEISKEQITDTLNWLLAAGTAAAEHEMDIDAIVEHLQIA